MTHINKLDIKVGRYMLARYMRIYRYMAGTVFVDNQNYYP